MNDIRENCDYLNETIRGTMRILEFLTLSSIDCVTAKDVSAFLNLPEDFCLECLINLAFDGYVRETERGFQTICLRVQKLDYSAHYALDRTFTDNGEIVPRMRLPSGEWQSSEFPNGN